MIRFERLAGPDAIVPVIDNGTYECRIGRAGQGYPDYAIPQIVAEGPPKATYVGDAYIGAVKRKMPITSTRQPIRRGAVSDWDAMEAVWRFGLEEKLGVPADQTPAVLLLDSLQQGVHDREVTAEIMFENLGVGGLRCELQTAAALYESQRPTAIVLDVGYGGSRVFATQDGLPLRISDTVNLGGQDVDDFIGRQLGEMGLSSLVARQCARFDLLSQLKHDCCVVTYGQQRPTTNLPYTMMNGLVVDLEPAQITAPDILFDPKLAGLAKRSVTDLLMDAINKVESDAVRSLLLQNIVVTGGPACTSGFCERLAAECQKRAAGVQVGVHAAGGTHQLAVPWMGGSIVANSPACVGVSKRGYEEYGSRIVRESFDWTSAEMACSDLRSRREAREEEHYRENQMPGPDNRQDLRQVFSDSTRSPRPTDLQLLSRVETVCTTPRGTEGHLATKVSTHATRNCQNVNVTGRSRELQQPQSGTLHRQGIDRLYDQEKAVHDALDQATRIVGEREGVHHTNPVPRLPEDEACMSPTVYEERSWLNSERLFSPSAATLAPRGTARIAINEGESQGMPLARFLSAEIDKGLPRGPRPPLNPRLYKQQEAEARAEGLVPRLPLSKLWSQGPTADEVQVQASAPIPAPHRPPAPTPNQARTHDNWQEKRIAQMQARVVGLSPRGPAPVADPMEFERAGFVPHSPCLAQVVEQERNRGGRGAHLGLEDSRVLGRSEGRSVAKPTTYTKAPAVPGSVVGVMQRPVIAQEPPERVVPVVEEPKPPRPRVTIEKTERLYENFKERHQDDVEATSPRIRAEHLSGKGAQGQIADGDHQRFMATEMRRVEKIISSIDEDDYEVLMALENQKVAQGLAISREEAKASWRQQAAPREPEMPTIPQPAPVPEPAPPAPPAAGYSIPVAKPREGPRAAAPAREDSSARAAKRREEAAAVRARVDADREARAQEARAMRSQHSSDAQREAVSSVASTNREIRSTATSANVKVPEGAAVHTPDDWAGSRGHLAASPVPERNQEQQAMAQAQAERRAVQQAMDEQRAEHELAAAFAREEAQRKTAEAEQAAAQAAAERERQQEMDRAAAQAAAEKAAAAQAAADQAAADKAARLAAQQVEYEAEQQKQAEQREQRQAAVRAEKEAARAAAAQNAAAQEQANKQRQAAREREWQRAQEEEASSRAAQAAAVADQNRKKALDDTLAASEAKVDRAMGNRPRRSVREARASSRNRGGRSAEEEAALKAKREAQNAELEMEKQRRAQAPSQYSQRASSPGRGDAQAKLDAITAGMDAEDLEDFHAMMAAEARKHQ